MSVVVLSIVSAAAVPVQGHPPADERLANQRSSSSPRRNWEVRVTGYEAPVLVGPAVNAIGAGPLVAYQLTGVAGNARLDLRGIKEHQTGSFSVETFRLTFRQAGIHCVHDGSGTTDRFTLDVTTEDAGRVRGTFAGGVRCGPSAGEQTQPARVEGWFIDDVD
jgi:hypothetical protein